MIHDDFSFRDLFCWYDPGLSLRNMELLKELRTLEKSIQDKMVELEKELVLNKESIMQEKVTLGAVQRELHRLERKGFYYEFGLE
jgi:hypothetical protein